MISLIHNNWGKLFLNLPLIIVSFEEGTESEKHNEVIMVEDKMNNWCFVVGVCDWRNLKVV